MKKLSIAILTAIMPFLMVWGAYIFTAFSFDVKDIFQTNGFWAFSIIYWFLWICLIPSLVDGVEETQF